MKELPRNPPTNPAAEEAKPVGRTEPSLEKAIDSETGGRVHPSGDEVRTDKTPEDKPHHH